jgi:hypothetical protein
VTGTGNEFFLRNPNSFLIFLSNRVAFLSQNLESCHIILKTVSVITVEASSPTQLFYQTFHLFLSNIEFCVNSMNENWKLQCITSVLSSIAKSIYSTVRSHFMLGCIPERS